MKKIDFNSYQLEAIGTAIFPKEKAMEYLTLGLCGESGEVANKIKKVLRDNDGKYSNEKRKEICDELGDVMWYLAVLAYHLNTDLETIANQNLEKLFRRRENNTIGGSGDNR